MISAERVRETTSTTGTGTITLAGAVAQHKTFASRVATGATCEYCILDANGSAWEAGLGTMASSTTLARTRILQSSNSDAVVSLSSGTHQVFITFSAKRAEAMDWGISVKYFGATGDGTTDDTTAINTAIAAMQDYGGKALVFPPGVYLVPAGVVVAKQGVKIMGLGHRANGPGGEGSYVGAVLKNTTAASWAMHIQPISVSNNSFEGVHIEGISFVGDADTAGGLFIQRSYCVVDRCGAFEYSTGIGMKIMHPVDADAAQNNELTRCESRNCAVAYQIGEPDMPSTTGHAGAAVTMMQFCSSLGNSTASGTGILCYDDSSQIFGGDFQGHTTGVYLRGNASLIGTHVTGVRTEGCTVSLNCTRNSGSGTATSNFCMGPFNNVTIGANNVGDTIIGGNGMVVTDNGSGTCIFNNGGYGSIQMWDDTSGGTPSGGHNGEIRMKANKLYYKSGGTWRGLTGT